MYEYGRDSGKIVDVVQAADDIYNLSLDHKNL